MRVPVNSNQKEIRAEIMALRSAQSKFEETTSKLSERTLASADQQLLGLFGGAPQPDAEGEDDIETSRQEWRRDGRNSATCVDSAGEPMGPRSLGTKRSL
jgi:hypothetical protein